MSASTAPAVSSGAAGGFTILSSRRSQRSHAAAGPTTSYHIHHSGSRHPCSSSSSTGKRAGYALETLSTSHLQHDEDVLMDEDGGDGAGDSGPSTIAVPGEPLASSSLFMRGHGTTLDGEGTITSTVCGTLVLTNKLLSIPPIRTRYIPEIGDLVIGQVTSLSPKRWKVDIHSRADASLLLSSINLPGGVQRRKLESDELQMRSFFAEDDWMVAEVQSVFHDGTVGLHTRSLRYGKLRNGTVEKVEAGRVKRLKSHFCTVSLPIGPASSGVKKEGGEGTVKLDVILGLNGYVWISKHVPFSLSRVEGSGGVAGAAESTGMAGKGTGRDVDAVYTDENEEIDAQVRRAISGVKRTVAMLDRWCVPISDVAIQKAYEILVQLDSAPGEGQGEPEMEVQRVAVEATLEATA